MTSVPSALSSSWSVLVDADDLESLESNHWDLLRIDHLPWRIEGILNSECFWLIGSLQNVLRQLVCSDSGPRRKTWVPFILETALLWPVERFVPLWLLVPSTIVNIVEYQLSANYVIMWVDMSAPFSVTTWKVMIGPSFCLQNLELLFV